MSTALPNSRIRSVDILRGIVMVIMALDHTREYFSNFYGNPTNLDVVSSGMFLTRWITHFCAPVFRFLAGTSAYRSLSKKQDKNAASLFLLKRGIWLLIVEVALVRFGWLVNIDYSLIIIQVIWAIGWSMIFLAGLIHLPYKAILTMGLVMIFGHNLLDVFNPTQDSFNGVLWHFIHQGGFIPFGAGKSIFVIYPLLPWVGVMATGYCFGSILKLEEAKRNRQLYLIGGTSIILFIIIRATNLYGDPKPWTVQDSSMRTVLSFLNCEKYPPSLLYLLMTLGPSILVMPLLEKMSNAAGRFFTVFGRVPMFYYIVHIYLIHVMAIIWAMVINVPINLFMNNSTIFAPKEGWGFELPVVYLAWVIAVLLLYYPSRWFMYVKQNNRQWWLSYL